ncbi:MAG: alpha/beta hydrolase [Sphingobacteriales bacterium 17-39-43]|uniref:alpha/beta fold hydrolase n=1 Tax=Daejeonella sp. TaxID=2805397 RepID=UPI000BDC77F9|nr:alpha/beta hydrolase [Daejeonella sp.]OYZ33365.1 MAG: alpha/beta hydrolase [Sphingobacteriales bacterium 16-39-50]OYZ57303.1 MAG: alpha/beta hydrolase [Sphingobacteriales bacterium 24-40-4]OZA24408.1 MAG: alpha/beta hydrolase [Sphingobacteriales bacterium 17-39-43]OZA56718.1 MAG: alpha/beta hydrolase [Sphingobacteriales bacterium 39-40-5]HQS06978.1 alpha/beta hydrolase [Daejeonella sp.]
MEFEIKEENGFKYIEEGEGEVLLLLHGLMGALSNWTDVVQEFKKDYRVIIPLLPLYDLPLLTTGVKTLAKFVHKFVKYKKLKNITVLGNSLGGHVGLIYTLNHQDEVKALVLTGSSGLYENAFGGSFPRRESYDFIKEKVEFTFYDPATATRELVDEVYQIVNDRIKVIKILAMAKSAIRHNMSKDIYKIKVPVCLIWGKNDKITPPEVAVEFNQLLPDSELNWVDLCGHAPMMERPVEFNAHLKRFLDRIY